MKRKRVITKERETSIVVYCSNKIRVSKELNGELFFEIGNELTSDLSEAVAMVMNLGINDDDFFKINFKINIKNISPDKTLYWLSGGDYEWVSKRNYNKSWFEVYLSFQEEFGLKVINIIENAETLDDVKKGFIKNLNLQTLYEYGLSKGYM
jgi:hypothetical protein